MAKQNLQRDFFLIAGPPAVGKMTVGQELAKKCNFKLLHNHMSIELTLTMFDFSDPEFKTINNGIRELVLNTFSKSENIHGAIFTLVWAFDLKSDWEYVQKFREMFESEGWNFHVVELFAPVEIRKDRNATSNRLTHKPSKRNVERSLENIVKWNDHYKMNTEPGDMDGWSFLRIDNSELTASEAADQIIEHFQLQLSDRR